MKIAYLSHSPLLTHVANAIHVMQMCSAFAANGHDVTLYARGRHRPRNLFASYGLQDEGFAVALLPKAPLKIVGRLAYALAQVVRAQAANRPDLYYARCPASAAFALLLGGDVVLEIHELPRKPVEKRIQRQVLRHRRLRRIVTISRALLDDLAHEHPGLLDGRDCVVAPDGAAPGTATAPFPLATGPGRQIGYAGGLRAGNGVGMLLALAEALPNDTFHVLGGGPGDVAAWKERQRTSNVVWYGRHEPARVFAFLAACDVLVAPYEDGPKTSTGRDTSRWMSPLKIFEYMAAGRAMVVADYPVLREVVSEDFALLAEPGRLDAWLAALRRLEDADLRARLGARARAVLEERYTWRARAAHVLAGLGHDVPAIARVLGGIEK